MTEYVILVGLIAILVVGAIMHFKDQLDVTIEGTDSARKGGRLGSYKGPEVGGAGGGLGKAGDQMSGKGSKKAGPPAGATSVSGPGVYQGKTAKQAQDGTWYVQ